MSDRPARTFTLDDFREILLRMRRMGPQFRDMLRKLGAHSLAGIVPDAEGEPDLFLAIIDAMTPEERRDPHKIDDQDLRRIAARAGCEPRQVSDVIALFDALAHKARRIAERRRIGEPRPTPRESEDWGLLERWEFLARSGGAPREAGPSFQAWNRDLRLWDFILDD